MSVTTESTASFDDTETRSDEMNSTVEAWVADLATDVDKAASSAEFQE